jgi:hypothetical protein
VHAITQPDNPSLIGGWKVLFDHLLRTILASRYRTLLPSSDQLFDLGHARKLLASVKLLCLLGSPSSDDLTHRPDIAEDVIERNRIVTLSVACFVSR